MSSFKIPLVDPQANPLTLQGLLGFAGFSKSHSGKLEEDDAVVIAIRKALENEKCSPADDLLLRSFFVAWTGTKQARLSDLAIYAVPLPRSVRMLEQIGFLERTVNYTVGGAVSIAFSVSLLSLTWSIAPEAVIGNLAVDAVCSLIPDSIFSKIDKSFGAPGEPVKRSEFDPATVFDLVRLCRLRWVAANLDLENEALTQTLHQLDRRLFTLFLANSRQLEGLALCGTSEASAAVAAHAAIALGLSELQNSETILKMWEQSVQSLSDSERSVEVLKTLTSIRNAMDNDIGSVERQISRTLASASATEAIDLATAPVGLTFQLLGMVANSMANVAPEGHFRSVFESANKGMEYAKSAADSTPDAVASTIDAGISAEAWIRKSVSRFWPNGDK